MKMALTEKQVNQIREELLTCKKPLFFFHDDADGLCSFLLLYRFIREGRGVIVKTTPKIDERFLGRVEEYQPDKIFVVDIAIVEQEFIDQAKTKIVWIDHHTPLQRNNISYFNPRKENPNDNIPVSYLCYQVVQQDLWISMVGCIGDWYWPPTAEEFKEKYPDLLQKEVNDPETALFETKLGKLINIISFSLKGKTQQAMQCAKIMTRIKTPDEIMNKETPAGKFLYDKYEDISKEYQEMLKDALKHKPEGKILLYEYLHGNTSFTKDLANELLHRFPDNIIIIAREKSNEMKVSLRSKHMILPPIVEKALTGVEGYGGGHEHACGANIKKKDFEKFIESIREQVEDGNRK
jgi:single-stranded DNA-specific DHH superfamily exonuclease